MKHFYATLIFLSSSLANAQCTSDILITSNGRGGYTFDRHGVNNPDAVASFILTMNSDTLLVDSNTLQTTYTFHTNSTYRICMHLMDTLTLCESDTCKELEVEDAEYHNLLEEVNRWTIISSSCPVLTDHGDPASRSNCLYPEESNSIWANQDTVVNGLNYKKLQLYWYYGYDYFCDWGIIREDTIERKVFIRKMDEASETLLYNFSLKSQDTLTLTFSPNSFYYTDGLYRVDSIQWVSTYPKKRRVYYLNKTTGSGNHTLAWVQGVGHLGHPIYSYTRNWDGSCYAGECNFFPHNTIIPINYQKKVSCFYHQEVAFHDSCTYNNLVREGSQYWFHIEDSCKYGLIGAIHEITSLKSLNISPNPTEGSITLQFDIKESSEFEIILHALDGRTVSGNYNLGRLSAGLQSRSLNLSNLSSGFYLLECRNKEGSVFKKLVISR